MLRNHLEIIYSWGLNDVHRNSTNKHYWSYDMVAMMVKKLANFILTTFVLGIPSFKVIIHNMVVKLSQVYKNFTRSSIKVHDKFARCFLEVHKKFIRSS